MLRKYVSRKSNLGGSVCSCGAQNTHTRSLTQLAIQKQEVCLDVVEVSVRSSLSSSLKRICARCLDQEQNIVDSDYGRCVVEKVLSITVRYLTDEPGVRCGAFETLSFLIERGFLDKATTEEVVCPVVEKLSRKPLETFDEELYAIFIHKLSIRAPKESLCRAEFDLRSLHTKIENHCYQLSPSLYDTRLPEASAFVVQPRPCDDATKGRPAGLYDARTETYDNDE
ncbi:AAEL007629-PA [Aedes aegypti]|uniref:AAEL007629-PA n=1 Tax=Aedes aegypti TaxID=7159 RepID=Q171I5_AEDAE|nr:AAEL007629-PA [Aedes aegypti]